MGDANSLNDMDEYFYISRIWSISKSKLSKKNNSKGCAGHHSTEIKLHKHRDF